MAWTFAGPSRGRENLRGDGNDPNGIVFVTKTDGGASTRATSVCPAFSPEDGVENRYGAVDFREANVEAQPRAMKIRSEEPILPVGRYDRSRTGPSGCAAPQWFQSSP